MSFAHFEVEFNSLVIREPTIQNLTTLIQFEEPNDWRRPLRRKQNGTAGRKMDQVHTNEQLRITITTFRFP